MKPIQIFRPGKHTDMNGQSLVFSEADLKASAKAYDPKVHEAPIVVGHPQADAPAYGWVKSVAFAAGELTATPDQIDAAFAEMVEKGRFKKVSASFYRPGVAANPKPDVWYLRHVGFLGAQPPAVKGLKPVAFADAGGDVVTIEFGEVDGWNVARAFRALRDFFIAEFGQEKADKALPGYVVDSLQDQAARDDKSGSAPFAERNQPDKETTDMSEKDAAKAAELKAQEDAIAAEKKKLDQDRADFAEARRRDQVAATLDALVKAGKVLPAGKPGLVAFMTALDDQATVQFGEGETNKKTASAFMADFLKALPARVDFKERGAENGAAPDPKDSDAIAQAAVAYQEEMKGKGVEIGIDVAVRHVIGWNT